MKGGGVRPGRRMLMRAEHRRRVPEPTAAVAGVGRNGKYISGRAKSPLHTPRGGPRTCVRFKRAVSALRWSSLVEAGRAIAGAPWSPARNAALPAPATPKKPVASCKRKCRAHPHAYNLRGRGLCGDGTPPARIRPPPCGDIFQ
ncbi:unnamed protein product, partial [Iphiclides podalirius]